MWAHHSESHPGLVKEVVDTLVVVLKQDVSCLLKNVLELNMNINTQVWVLLVLSQTLQGSSGAFLILSCSVAHFRMLNR